MLAQARSMLEWHASNRFCPQCAQPLAWISALEDADAILVRWPKVTPEIIRRLRRCRIIVRYGVGYDNVDYDAATAAGMKALSAFMFRPPK